MGFSQRKRNEHNEHKNPLKPSPAQCEEWSVLGSRAREMRDEGDEEGQRARKKKKLTGKLRDEGGWQVRETGKLRDEGDERPVS